MDFRLLEKYRPQVLALLRIVAGLLFVEHATQKFFSFPAPFPVQPLPTMLLAAGVIELVAGTLITLGLFTRLAAFIAAGEMAAAYFIGHFSTGGFWPVVNKGEAAILFCFVFLYIAAAGPGAWGLDAMRMKRPLP
ncbi:MAG TPA: DoxX family protein [Sphingomicrobium sp.]